MFVVVKGGVEIDLHVALNAFQVTELFYFISRSINLRFVIKGIEVLSAVLKIRMKAAET